MWRESALRSGQRASPWPRNAQFLKPDQLSMTSTNSDQVAISCVRMRPHVGVFGRAAAFATFLEAALLIDRPSVRSGIL